MVWSGARVHGDITCELCHTVIHTKAEIHAEHLSWLLPSGWSQLGRLMDGDSTLPPRFFCPRPACREQAEYIQAHNYYGPLTVGK